MAQYSNLKAYIEEKIYENGTQAITGDILQDVLKVMTDDLGEFYQMGGVASPSTDPGTPDAKVIYFATEAGTYTNFGGITLEAGEVALLIFETSWTKETLNVLSAANGGVKTANLADGAVTTAKIAGGAVETAKIANSAVTSGKVADGAIGTAKIADGAIDADKIAANAVESAKIKNGAVTEGKINDGAVTAGKVAANAVTTAKIADDAVTTAKLNDGAVTEDKIATDAVTSGKVKDGAIGTAKIAAGAVTHAKIGAGAVEESNIKDGAVTSDKIANGAVGSDQLAEGAFSAENLADGSITTDKLADEAVTAEKIADGAVTAGKFANGSVTTIKLGSGAVTTEKIGDGMVTRQKLADSSVGTSKIIDGAVTTDKVADGAITDAKLENPVSVSQNTETGKTELKIGDEAKLIVDKEAEAGSHNLVESGGVFDVTNASLFNELLIEEGGLNTAGAEVDVPYRYRTSKIYGTHYVVTKSPIEIFRVVYYAIADDAFDSYQNVYGNKFLVGKNNCYARLVIAKYNQGSYDNPIKLYEIKDLPSLEKLNEIIKGKVDKIEGKVLSDNNFSDEEKEKLESITEIVTPDNIFKGKDYEYSEISAAMEMADSYLTGYNPDMSVSILSGGTGLAVQKYDISNLASVKITLVDTSLYLGQIYCFSDTSDKYISGQSYDGLVNSTPDFAIATTEFVCFDILAYKKAHPSVKYLYLENTLNASIFGGTNEISFYTTDFKWLKTKETQLVLPAKIVGVTGIELNIYKDNVLLYGDVDSVADVKFMDYPNDYCETKHRFSCTATATRNTNPSFSVFFDSIKEPNLAQQVNFKIIDKTIVNALNRSILIIGDSKVDNGRLPSEFKKDCVDNGLVLPNGRLLGSRYNSTFDVYHEGRAGWSSSDYMSASKGAVANAFYNPTSQAFDFSYYMQEQGYTNVDYVFINLGTNDYLNAAGLDSLAYIDEFISNINTMITSIHSYDSDIRIVIGLTEGVCTLIRSGSFDDYLNNPTTRARLLNAAAINEYDRRENENIFVCPLYIGMDMKNDYNLAEYPLSARDAEFNTGKTRLNFRFISGDSGPRYDGIHQNAVGYGKNADYMFATLCYIETINP